MAWRDQTRVLLVLLSCAIGCESPPELSQDPVIVPLQGQWESPALSFQVEKEGIAFLQLNNLGCLGEVTPAGVPICDSLIEGGWNLPRASPLTQGGLFIDTPFGLQLEGDFQSEDIFAGTYTYKAPNGCCSSEGSLTASHESLAKEFPVPVCHVTTGEEQITLHKVDLEDSGLPSEPALANFDKVQVVDGFQGGTMVVVAVLTQNLALGDLNVTIDLQVPTLDISARAETSHLAFTGDQEDGELSPVWLLLEDESGELITMNNANVLEEAEAEVTLQVTSSCGFIWTKKFAFRLFYAS